MEKLAEKIKALGTLKPYPKGALLFQAEDKAVGFYFIQWGEVRVFKMDEQGRELEVARLGPGDFLGEAIAFVSGRFPFFAQAVKDSTVRYFDKKAVVRAIETDPSAARFFIELLAQKCIILSGRVESLGLRTVRQRLIQYLLTNCSGACRCVVELKIKKGELARLLGTISETLSRNLKKMQEEGLIEVRGPVIQIKNCLKLRWELAS